MCSVRITEQTAIISLYSINWLVFITETECVYYAVRIESLNTKEARVRFHVSPCEICGGQRYTGTGFSPRPSVSPVSIIPPMLHTHSSTTDAICFSPSTSVFPFQYHSTNAPCSSSLCQDTRAMPGNILKCNTLFWNRGQKVVSLSL
jgi:hypothetical protein